MRDSNPPEGFEPSGELLDALTQLGTQRGAGFDEAGFAASQEIMRTQLKALAAQRLFGTGAYFRVVNPRLASAYKLGLGATGKTAVGSEKIARMFGVS